MVKEGGRERRERGGGGGGRDTRLTNEVHGSNEVQVMKKELNLPVFELELRKELHDYT